MTGHRRSAVRRALLGGAVVAALAVTLVGPAGADTATGISKLSVRKIDSTDTKHPSVSIIYTGARKDLEGLTIREDGKQVLSLPPVPLAKAGIKKATVFAVDTSRSMGSNGGLAQTKKSLHAFVAEMGDGDRFGLVSFGTDVSVLSRLTGDARQADKAIDELSAPPDASTALFDGVKRAAGLLGDDQSLQPNLVLITDGFDDSSVASQAQAQSAVAGSGAAMFALAYNQQGQVDGTVVAKLVAKAGGALIDAPRSKDLASGLVNVRTALDSQYVVSFTAGESQGATDLEVSVGGESATKSYVPGSVSTGSASLDPPTIATSKLPDFIRSTTGKLLGVGGLFVAIALGVFSVVTLVSRNESALDTALNPYTEGWTGAEEGEDASLAQTAIFQRAVELTEDFAERQGLLEKVESKLERANLPLRAAEALFVYGVAVVLLGLLAMVVEGPLVGLILAAVVAFVPKFVLNFLANRRKKQFETQLPDMLALLAGSLRAGYSLMQGVEAVSQEVAEPMGKELRRVCTEARLGRELEESLDGVGERMDSADFEWAVMAIRIQREVGGNLSELLQTVGDTMIERERLRREVASLTAEGKISAIMLGIMPVALAVVMYVVNPAYMGVLFSETIGRILLGIGTLSALIGFAWMKKVITIEI